MDKKTFRIYSGIILIDLIFLSIFSLYIIFFNKIPRNLASDLFMVVFMIFGIYMFLRHISFKLEIINNEVIKESALFSEEKQIKISEIKKISRGYYSLFTYSREKGENFLPRLLMLIFSQGKLNPFSAIAMISLKDDFPSMPVSFKIIEAIYDLNSNVNIDKQLNDFIPGSIRKKIGIKLTVTDKIGLWLWRVLTLILVVIVLGIILLMLVATFKK